MRSKPTSSGEFAHWALKLAAFGSLLFLNVPLLIIFLYAFTTDEATFTFPLPGLTTQWFAVALGRSDLWNALWLTLRVAAVATLAALVLGTLAAAAVYRSDFFGKDSSRCCLSSLWHYPVLSPALRCVPL